MNQIAKKEIGACLPCQMVTSRNSKDPIISTELPSEPWDQLDMDFSGP